jgi:protein lifeguard
MGFQVLFTALFTWWIIASEGRKKFCQDNIWLYFVCIVATVVIMCTLICFKSAARKVPTNYILLAGFTVFESYIVGTIASLYDPNSVILAAIYTVALFTVLTLYACCTKGDIGCMGPIIAVSMVLGLLTFILYFIFPSDTMHLIFCWVGLIITCIYVIYDVYLITEKHGLEYDDYIIGALLIYTDIISIFIYILSIIGDRN